MFLCEACDAIVADEQEKRAARDAADAIESALTRSGLPLAYRDGSRGFGDVHDAGAVKLAGLVRDGYYPGLYVFGPAGPDKTTLASSLLAAFIRGGNSGLYVSAADMVTDIDATRLEGAQISRADIVKPLIETQVLVLDDLGKERGTDYVAGILLQILDGRYRNLSERQKVTRALIITSNYPLDRLCERFKDDGLSEPIRRRIAELTVTLEMK